MRSLRDGDLSDHLHETSLRDLRPRSLQLRDDLQRLQKFSNTTTTMQSTCSRTAMLKAFEYLRDVEIVASINNRAQKEYQMYRLLLSYGQIKEAISKYQGMPTEIVQWAKSSLI